MGIFRSIRVDDKESNDYLPLLRRYAFQFYEDSGWLRTRIDMYLARHGRQWRWTEELRAADKNLQVLTYNVIANLIEQKVALIADIDSPAEFMVSSESSGESDVNRRAMLFLNYCYAKSGGSRLFERSVEMACTIGQDMQYFEPHFDPITNEFYIKFSRIPFYRYHVLGNPRDEYFSDAGGLVIYEDVGLSEVSRKLKLTQEQERHLYEHRNTFNDFASALSDFGVTSKQTRELINFFKTDAFKEFHYDYNYLNGFNASTLSDFNVTRNLATVRVMTYITRGEKTKVYKVERAGSLERFAAVRSPQDMLEMAKPNWNYCQRIYFEEELKMKRKQSDGKTFTLESFIEEDIRNGFAVMTPLEIYPVIVRKFYGKYVYDERVYATEQFPFTPIHRIWQDDKYSIGDVDSVYDIQRVYNESMTLIKGVQEEMRLGDRYIFNEEFRFSLGGEVGDHVGQQEILDELMRGERRAVFGAFPRGEGEKFIKITSQAVAPDFIRYVYDMPNTMMSRMGLQPYLMGEGGQPRTAYDANARATFGSAQIKNTAFAMHRSVAEHARKALIYAQLEAKMNIEIETGEERVKLNEMRYSELTGRYMVANELKFDGSPLRISFRNTEYHRNQRVKTTIIDVLRYLPQGSPVAQMLAEMIIRLEEIPELDEILKKSAEASQFMEKLAQAEQQIQVLSKEMRRIESENQDLKVNLDVQKRIAIGREKINRELNKLVSEIRTMSLVVRKNAEKEIALQMERVGAMAEKVVDMLDTEMQDVPPTSDAPTQGANLPTSPSDLQLEGGGIEPPPALEEEAIPPPISIAELQNQGVQPFNSQFNSAEE